MSTRGSWRAGMTDRDAFLQRLSEAPDAAPVANSPNEVLSVLSVTRGPHDWTRLRRGDRGHMATASRAIASGTERYFGSAGGRPTSASISPESAFMNSTRSACSGVVRPSGRTSLDSDGFLTPPLL